jgi:hypothetical protein
MSTENTSAPRSVLARIFLSPSERRLRAGWRLLIQFILFVLLTVCTTIPFLIAINFSSNTTDTTRQMLVSTIAGFIAITVSVFLARRFLDKRSFTSLGLQLSSRAIPDLLAGIVITFVMMVVIFGIELSLGWIQLVDKNTLSSLPVYSLGITISLWLFIFILTGWQEELLTRGYQLQNFMEGTNTLWGAILSSLIFAVLHSLNPGASPIAIAGLFLAGLFFVYAYLRTGQLWLAIGLHIGWNFFEGPVFGFPVSGLAMPSFILQYATGPDLWTGGKFGPEAGLIILPALALGALMIYAYTHPDIRANL